jgi:hypothetical protein
VSEVPQADLTIDTDQQPAAAQVNLFVSSKGIEGVNVMESFVYRLIFLRDQLKRKITANNSYRRRKASIANIQAHHCTALSNLMDERRSEFNTEQAKRRDAAQAAEAQREHRFSSALARSSQEMMDLQHSTESNFQEQENYHSLKFLQAQRARETEFFAALNELKDRCLRAEKERQAEFELWVRGTLRSILKKIDQRRTELIRREEERDDWLSGVLSRRPPLSTSQGADSLKELELRWWSRFERSYSVGFPQ